MKKLFFETRDEWRQWLASNYDKSDEVWLVYYKKDTGKDCLDYGASVEEALCFGWVDSLIKKLDEDSICPKIYSQKR